MFNEIEIDNLFYDCQLIRTIMSEEYGAGLGCFDPGPALWAAEKIAERVDAKTAKRELEALNKLRASNGLPSARFAYGHELF